MHLPDHGNELVHVFKIKHGVDALAIKIHGHGHDIHIASSLAVAHQRSFYPVGPSHHAKLAGSHSTAAIIVSMERNKQCLTSGNVIAKPLNLIGINIRRAHLHRGGQVDNHRGIRGGLKHFIHRIADLHRKIELGASKTLRAVFKGPCCVWIAGGLRSDEFGARYPRYQ